MQQKNVFYDSFNTLLYFSYLVYASYKHNCSLAYYIVHTVKTGIQYNSNNLHTKNYF